MEDCHDQMSLQMLLERAEEDCQNDYWQTMNPCDFLYHDKMSYHFESVMQDGGVLRKQIKDDNGDPLSPINDELMGVYFSANVHNVSKEPIIPSNYGDRRLNIPVSFLLQKYFNLYFADYYCLTRNARRHYVTLVITRPNSYADNFCQNHLIELDIEDNDFFTYDRYSRTAEVSSQVWVEIFMTENINVGHLLGRGAYFEDVACIPQANGLRRGLAKRWECSQCNV